MGFAFGVGARVVFEAVARGGAERVDLGVRSAEVEEMFAAEVARIFGGAGAVNASASVVAVPPFLVLSVVARSR